MVELLGGGVLIASKKAVKARRRIKVKGGAVSQAEFEKLSPEEQKLLKKLGVEGYNKDVKRRGDEFAAANVELSAGGWVDRVKYDSLSPEDQKLLDSIGMDKFNARNKVEFEANNVDIGGGEWMPRKGSVDPVTGEALSGWDDLTTEQQDYLKAHSMDDFKAWSAKRRAEFEVNNVNVGGDVWIPRKGSVDLATGKYRSGWDDLDAEQQDYLKTHGVDAYEKWVGETIAKAEAEVVEFESTHMKVGDDVWIPLEGGIDPETGEHKSGWKDLNEEQQNYLKEHGLDAFTEWMAVRSVEYEKNKAEFEANNIDIGGGEWIPRKGSVDPTTGKLLSGWEDFTKEQQEFLMSHSLAEFNALMSMLGADFERNNINIGGDSWMPRKGSIDPATKEYMRGWNDLNEKERKYLLDNGIKAFNEWVAGQPIYSAYNPHTRILWLYKQGEWLFYDPNDTIGSELTKEEYDAYLTPERQIIASATLIGRQQEVVAVESYNAQLMDEISKSVDIDYVTGLLTQAVGVSTLEITPEAQKYLDTYEVTEGAEPKFFLSLDAGVLPSGALYAGQDSEGNPQYYETTEEQLSDVEKALVSDITYMTGAPLYYLLLLERVGISVPRMTDEEWAEYQKQAKDKGVALAGLTDAERRAMADVLEAGKQWGALSKEDKQRVISIYYWQSTQEEGRQPRMDILDQSIQDLQLVWEAAKYGVEVGAAKLPRAGEEEKPLLTQEVALAAGAVVVTIGEFITMFPLIAAKVALNPSAIKDIAFGIKDFTVDVAKGAYHRDPYAIGQMAIIVGALFLGARPMVGLVKRKVGSALASKLKTSLDGLENAIRTHDPVAIRNASNSVKGVGEELKANPETAAEGEYVSKLGKRASEQADGLSTLSVETMEGIKFQLENAGGAETVSTGRGRYVVKPQVSKTLTQLKVLGPKDVGMTASQFDRFVKARTTNPSLSPTTFKLGENLEYQRLMSEVAKMGESVREIPKPVPQPIETPKSVRKLTEVEKSGRVEPAEAAITRRMIEEAAGKEKPRSVSKEFEERISQQARKESEIARAKEIVEKARENEARINKMAEEAMVELEAMEMRKAGSSELADTLAMRSQQELIALAAAKPRQLVSTITKLQPADMALVIAKFSPALQSAVIFAVSSQTSAATAEMRAVAQQELTETLLEDAIQTEIVQKADVFPMSVTHIGVATIPAGQTRIDFATEFASLTPYPTPSPYPAPYPAPSPTPAPTPSPRPAPEPYPEPEPIAPERGKPKRIIPPPILPSGGGGADSQREFPAGTIAWRQGESRGRPLWKVIPPPYDIPKPITILYPPAGAKYTDIRGKGSVDKTIQTIGGPALSDVYIDLGIFDIKITAGEERPRIQFKSGGLTTDVGTRISSPTTGMSPRRGLGTVGQPAPVSSRLSLAEEIDRSPPVAPQKGIRRRSMGRGFAGKNRTSALDRYYLGRRLPPAELGGIVR